MLHNECLIFKLFLFNQTSLASIYKLKRLKRKHDFAPKACFVAFCALGILFLGREGSKKQNGNVVIWFLGRSNITAQREFLLWKHSTWTQRNCYIGDWKDDLPEWFPFFTFSYLGQLELDVDKFGWFEYTPGLYIYFRRVDKNYQWWGP